jgi:hypothetical protein
MTGVPLDSLRRIRAAAVNLRVLGTGLLDDPAAAEEEPTPADAAIVIRDAARFLDETVDVVAFSTAVRLRPLAGPRGATVAVSASWEANADQLFVSLQELGADHAVHADAVRLARSCAARVTGVRNPRDVAQAIRTFATALDDLVARAAGE